MPKIKLQLLGFALGMSILWTEPLMAQETRIKDLVQIRGVRSNFLNGIGLVVGLKASGDSNKSLATTKAVASMLTRMGMNTKPEEIVTGNMAAVMVTAELPPFAKIGGAIDVKVSAIGDAKSLAGGTLILTPLRAGDQEVYAVAQGAVAVGQANGNGAQVLTVARVPQGATVEREFVPVIGEQGTLTLSLNQPDFTTAMRIAEGINARLKGFYANAKDIGGVELVIPPHFTGRLVEFVAEIEGIKVDADTRAVVVLNERTGTVVMGSGVVIQSVSIAHGDLSIQIGTDKEKGAKNVVNLGGATVGELIETMNALGVKPSDLIGILQSIHAAGAMQADLKFI